MVKKGNFLLKGRRESLMENLQPFLLKTFQLDRTKCLKIALHIPRASSNLLSDVSRDEVPQLPSRSCSIAQHIALSQPPRSQGWQEGICRSTICTPSLRQMPGNFHSCCTGTSKLPTHTPFTKSPSLPALMVQRTNATSLVY